MADEQPWKIPPIVQELAAGVHEPPRRYLVREQDRPAMAGVTMSEPIPIVDLSRLSPAPSDDHGADEAAKLRSALQNWGFFLFWTLILIHLGHGVDPGLLAEMMKATRQFYNLPLEEKKRHSNLVNGKEFRLQGYGGDMMVAEDQGGDNEVTA
uniref:Non-haem dioxygenase N-terminal domain-containing protein n=1 Tax=Setaria viridis TaxID=4556 RepID=A0A4U6UTK2_SETVI|nr:hypothetical protein SEVIR_4G052100v2 [Setaria viridis]